MTVQTSDCGYADTGLFLSFCKLAVYIGVCTFSFCATRAAEMSLCTLECPFFFEPPKKNRRRKRRPPETPIPLRMSVIAKWAKLAALKQTPIFNAMPPILIVRQSRTTSHSRNGAVWKQMRTITDKGMLRKPCII